MEAFRGRGSIFGSRMNSDQMDAMSQNSEGLISVASGRASPTVPATPDAQARLLEFRDKHAKAMEVLKKGGRDRKSGGGGSQTPSDVGGGQQDELSQSVTSVASGSLRIQAMAMHGTAAQPVGQQFGGGAGSGFQVRQMTEPLQQRPSVGSPGAADSDRMQHDAAEVAKTLAEIKDRQAGVKTMLEGRLGELQEDTKGQIAEIRGVLDYQAQELQALLAQEPSGQLEELRVALEAQGRELDALRSQELHISVRTLKENIDTYDKMGSRRAQEMQVALAELQDAVKAQARDLEAMRARDGAVGAAVKEGLEQQGQALQELGPQTQALQAALTAVRGDVEAHGTMLAELSRQVKEQHQERVEEMRRLRESISMQQRGGGLYAELDAQREQGKQQQADMSNWQDERKRLQQEIVRLAAQDPSRSNSWREVNGGGGGESLIAWPDSRRQAAPLLIVAVLSAGFMALLLRPGSSGPPAAPSLGHHPLSAMPFCPPLRAAGLRQPRRAAGRRRPRVPP